ncbi:hypothetical protein QLX08_006670 [Tetragonisca angustula]|uniref:Uncharacterized protein n=1 Tax=Tetragonisca angustula TaxID=166442 RepID=A0AAW0ZSV6_9HYME
MYPLAPVSVYQDSAGKSIPSVITVDQSGGGYSGKNHREQSVQLNAHPQLRLGLQLRNQLDADPRDQPSRYKKWARRVPPVIF